MMRKDFKEVLDHAASVGLGIVGGQVQFKLPDGTCELYWRNYDTKSRLIGESWTDYCQRTRIECLDQFDKLPSDKELIAEGIENFEFLKVKSIEGTDLKDFLIFIIYFNDLETELEQQ